MYFVQIFSVHVFGFQHKRRDYTAELTRLNIC